ncbi:MULTISPECIES: type IV secretion system protein [unclassified Sphingomonas]|uniref:type IV secretion system protein n=1 Tax=unclassified Sphingomonas TaxID=196159 RepID=UPI0006FA15D1|nr:MULTISPECIES: type IV secretion system protein [unclassified Sphingomonas]KRB78799.1 type VI secretion protein [Sphingomonas sp. Root710]KRB93710.1 type VI secretion protein [Sphingomonas sp. Root720]
MWIKRTLMGIAAPAAVAVFAPPAAAQGIPVFDTTTYLQALQTARQTLTMVEQGKQQIETAANQLQSLQKLTNMSEIASTLNLPSVRNLLPATTTDVSTLFGGDLTKLGSLGTLASNIQSRYRPSSTGSSDADAAYAQALKDSTGSAATTAALGENTLNIAQTRTQALDQLRQQLASAKDPKDVMDLQARIAVEQAQLQNDLLKMQAIQMAQAGEGDLAISSALLAAGRNDSAFFQANTIRK